MIQYVYDPLSARTLATQGEVYNPVTNCCVHLFLSSGWGECMWLFWNFQYHCDYYSPPKLLNLPNCVHDKCIFILHSSIFHCLSGVEGKRTLHDWLLSLILLMAVLFLLHTHTISTICECQQPIHWRSYLYLRSSSTSVLFLLVQSFVLPVFMCFVLSRATWSRCRLSFLVENRFIVAASSHPTPFCAVFVDSFNKIIYLSISILDLCF